MSNPQIQLLHSSTESTTKARGTISPSLEQVMLTSLISYTAKQMLRAQSQLSSIKNSPIPQVRKMRRKSTPKICTPNLELTQMISMLIKSKFHRNPDHSISRVVLQRQFFEAIVRAASIKYANNQELSTLSQKLDHLFENHLKPKAGKNKAKTAEEEVSRFPLSKWYFRKTSKSVSQYLRSTSSN